MGLILNEVLSNALKHAFPDNRSGNIEVAVKKEAADLILLVKDDGIGFNYEPYKGKSTSFGLMLIEDFARKLKAEMQFRNHHGSSFRLKIPDYQFAKQ